MQMFHDTRQTPHLRPQTTQSRHNNPLITVMTLGPLDFQHFPPNYPEYYYFYPNIDPPPGTYARSSSPPTDYGMPFQSHWTRDLDGNVISAIGQIQTLPSDAGTEDLENLESIPLPPDATPPPPPQMRTAELPPSSPSDGSSGRTSRLGSVPIIPEDEGSEENALLREPSGSNCARTRTHNPLSGATNISRLRELLSQPPTRPSSPPSRLFPDQPLFSSPPPASSPESINHQPSEMSNDRLHTFSPFQSNPSSATRRGSFPNPQMHPAMPFEPQSTSSPFRNTNRSTQQTKNSSPSGTSDPRSNPASHPRGPAPPPRQSPVESPGLSSPKLFAAPPSGPYPERYNQPPAPAKYTEVPVNLPHLYDPEFDRQHASMFDSRFRPTTSSEPHQPQEPPQPHQGPPPMQANFAFCAHPPPQCPRCAPPFPFFGPHGYVPYPVAERIENGYVWDGYAWRHPDEPSAQDGPAPANRDDTKRAKRADPRASQDKPRKDHPPTPAVPTRTPLAPSQAQHGVPSGSSQVEDALEVLHRRLDTLHRSVIHDHWTNLDSYFKNQTDPAFVAFVGPHTSVSSRIRRLLDKLLSFLAESLTDYTKMQAASEHWFESWRKQLSSMDRTMQAFCEFSSVVCNREPSFRMLDKVLAKINQYETKFRDLAKKVYTLLNRLRLREAHSALVKAHTDAKEQLRNARSRRDLPKWDEDKTHRAKLREDFISLQNRLASSRRPSWAVSRPSSRDS